MRLMRLFAISAVFVGSMLGIGATPASASTPSVCEDVSLRGDLVLPTDVGDCFPMNASFCDLQGVSTGLGLNVYVYVCLPEGTTTP